MFQIFPVNERIEHDCEGIWKGIVADERGQ
jgi:hypothetical protein